MPSVVKGKLVQDIELVSSLSCIWFQCKAKILEIFAHEVDVVAQAQEGDCEGHNPCEGRVGSKGIVYIGECWQYNEGDRCFESECEMRGQGLVGINDS